MYSPSLSIIMRDRVPLIPFDVRRTMHTLAGEVFRTSRRSIVDMASLSPLRVDRAGQKGLPLGRSRNDPPFLNT